MLVAVSFQNPLLWAVFVGWIMSVVLHEFAHGLVAWWGGDYTIRDRGGLTLNPLQYVDPVMSLLIPAVILLLGGIPLPGGVTYVRTDLLRARHWQTLVSLAGPLANVMVMIGCLLPLAHGWVSIGPSAAQSSNTAVFLGAMVVLQAVAAMLNLLPIPPLDGFNAVRPYLNPSFGERLAQPQVALIGLLGLFLVLSTTGLVTTFYVLVARVLRWAGVESDVLGFLAEAFNRALFDG